MKNKDFEECIKCHRLHPTSMRCPWCESGIIYSNFDFFKAMLALQKGFQTKYKDRFKGKKRITKLGDAIAIIQEASELIDATNRNKKGNNYKWWSDKVHMREERLFELVDIWHFFMLYMIIEKISPEEFFQTYIKKLGENYARQESGAY